MSVMVLAIAAMLQTTAVPTQPQIIVSGEGVVRLKPDIVTVEYSVHGEGRTSNEAVAALNATVRRVENSLAGIDPQTAALSKSFRIVIIRGEDCKSERYDEELKLSVGKCAIAGYVAEQSFTARSTRVDDAGTIISAISRSGAVSPRIDEFSLQDRKAARAQAISQAIDDARAKAEAVAAANRATLGPAIDVELDNARNESITVTGSRMTRYQDEAEPPIPVIVRPELEEVTAKVKVTYRVGR